jgi:Zn-dependent protease/CBS domain-containing protein
MFRTRWKVFRLVGIPIYIDASWLIIATLLTLSLSGLFSQLIPEITPALSLFWGLMTALGFFLCILLHELGHAVAAQRMQMPVRGITLFLFGGVAEMADEPPSPRKEFLMAVAGPAVSVVLAMTFWALSFAGQALDWFLPPVVAFSFLAYINTAVLLFNLVPAFPLDGGRVLRSALWAVTGNLRKATYRACQAGQAFAWVLIGLGILQVFAWGDFLGGMWMGLIGLFLNNAAQQSYQQVVLRQMLQGEPARRFMTPDPATVPPTLSLREWVEEHVYRQHHKAFPVVSDGRLEGFITTAALASIPRSEWDLHTVGEAMRQDVENFSVRPDTDALDVLQQMQRTGASQLLVVDHGRLEGIISIKDLLRFFELKLELESEEVAATATRMFWPSSGQKETERGARS